MSTLFLMRHGQASFGQKNYDRLSELGRRQAELTGRYLGRHGQRFDAAYCGAMDRQRATAEAALAGLDRPPKLTVIPEFNEYNSGTIIKALLPGMIDEEPDLAPVAERMYQDRRAFQAVYEGAMLRWISGRYDIGPAEPWAEFTARIEAALGRVMAENGPGRTAIVFTSGGPISAVARHALALNDETALRLTWVIKNASLSSFLYNRTGLSLFTFNSTAHLEPSGGEDLITYR